MVLCEVALPKGVVALPKGGVALPKGGVALPKGGVAIFEIKIKSFKFRIGSQMVLQVLRQAILQVSCGTQCKTQHWFALISCNIISFYPRLKIRLIRVPFFILLTKHHLFRLY